MTTISPTILINSAFRLLVILVTVVVLGCAGAPDVTTDPSPGAIPDFSPGVVHRDPGVADPGVADPGVVEPSHTPDAGRRTEPFIEVVTPVDLRAAAVESTLAALSIEQRVGQLFIIGFPVDGQGRALRALTPQAIAVLETVQPGGVLLFGQNVHTTVQLLALLEELQSRAALPLFIAIDHEGGAISRITASGHIPATLIPSPHVVGRVADEALAYRLGAVVGRELRSLGVNMNFAPVADLLTNPQNVVIGNRSYGNDPELVGRIVAAMVRGMQSERLASVLKHFPGHGDTYEDTHYEAAVVRHDSARLSSVELVPFRRGIEAGAAGVMTAHVGAPEVTGSGVPATLSSVLLQEVLREQLGFDGLVISDALNMHALTRYYDRNDVAVQAFIAGVDILLHPERPVEAYRAVLGAVQTGRVSEDRLEQSVRRVLEAKYDLGLLEIDGQIGQRATVDFDPAAILGNESHKAVVEEIVRRHNRNSENPTD